MLRNCHMSLFAMGMPQRVLMKQVSHSVLTLPARVAFLFLLLGSGGLASAQEAPVVEEVPPVEEQTLTIREYRVVGARKLPREEVETAVYSYMGPGRTTVDVEAARTALEKAYKDKGFQTVSVNVPQQRGRGGVIVLHVTEAPIGRLRVTGSRFFNIDQIKRRARSLAEGSVPDFNEVQAELLALNKKPDLRVTPEFRPGAVPGTIDVDLVVQDTFPFHASAELNNRYSANTTPLRVDLSARYENLWQLGHTIGFGFQIAPQRPDDATVYSAYYIAPVPGLSWLSVMVQGIRQNSDVSTLGGTAVAGNGEVYGGKLLFDLPSRPGLFHTASIGFDYKNFKQDLALGNEVVESPITYYPFVLAYNGFWMGTGYQLEFDAALTFSIRGLGSDEVDFDNRRYGADGNFAALRGSLGVTRDLPFGFQFFTMLQGQAAGVPLIDTEQFALGGVNTVRGYLEAEVLGDSAVGATFELRSPSLVGWLNSDANEIRLFTFLDAGAAWLNDPLPEQAASFSLWSFGFGGTFRVLDHFNSSLFVGFPQVTQTSSIAGQPFFSFRVWGEL